MSGLGDVLMAQGKNEEADRVLRKSLEGFDLRKQGNGTAIGTLRFGCVISLASRQGNGKKPSRIAPNRGRRGDSG